MCRVNRSFSSIFLNTFFSNLIDDELDRRYQMHDQNLIKSKNEFIQYQIHSKESIYFC